MVTQISLGSFGTQNGRNVLTGGASQLDTKTLIDNLVKAKRLPADRLETANKLGDSRSEAYTELRTLLSKLQTAASNLRNPPGVAVASKDIFSYRTASITSSLGATASNFLDVSLQPGAAVQNYTVDSITTLARQTKQESGIFSVANSTTASVVTANGSPTAGLFQAGTINLRAVDGTVGGIAVTLKEGDSLQSVTAKINEVSSRTGIQASVLTVASGSYKLIFTATKTGTTYGFDLGATSPAPGAGIVSDASGVFSQLAFSTTQTAQNALFSLDGVALTRESNVISDAVDNVTFTLKQPTGVVAGVLTANVTPDATLINNAVVQFADAYNEIRLFASEQLQLDDEGKPKESSVLYSELLFRTIVNNINDEVTRTVAGVTGTDPKLLADVGITLDNFDGDEESPSTRNILNVDTDKLQSALLANFDGVRKLFQFQQTSDDVNFSTFQRSNKLTITSFVLTFDRTAGTYRATYTDPTTNTPTTVNLKVTEITGGGFSLTGDTGSVFEGSQFVYAGTTTTGTVNVAFTQGYGDRFFNLADSVINSSNGTLVQQLTLLSDESQRNQEEIRKIDERLITYRDNLVQQYASLEAAISKANQILQLLDAQNTARSSN